MRDIAIVSAEWKWKNFLITFKERKKKLHIIGTNFIFVGLGMVIIYVNWNKTSTKRINHSRNDCRYFCDVLQMDVCDENYVSHERNEKIPNSEVVAIQFSPDGTWLATSQIRHDPKFSSDTLIKFWQFDRKSQL